MYSRLLTAYPLATRCITSGLLFSFSDALTQKFIQKKQKFDYRRNFNLVLTATVYLGPYLYFWFNKLLPKILFKVLGQSTSKVLPAFVGMLFDQFGATPPYVVGWFIFANWVQDFTLSSAQRGLQQAKQKIGQTLLASYKLWPAIVMLNLFFVPIQYQALFINVTGVLWNMYMSYITYR